MKQLAFERVMVDHEELNIYTKDSHKDDNENAIDKEYTYKHTFSNAMTL